MLRAVADTHVVIWHPLGNGGNSWYNSQRAWA
jgi:hypothetical protein